jgi:hypothetical protein
MMLVASEWVGSVIHEKKISRLSLRIFMALTCIAGAVWCLLYGLLGLPSDVLWQAVVGSISFDSSEYALPDVQPVFPFHAVAGVCLVAAVVFSAWRMVDCRCKSWKISLCYSLLPVLLSVFFTSVMLPALADELQVPAKDMCLSLREIDKTYDVVSYGLWKPSMLFYMNRDVRRFKTRQVGQLDTLASSDSPLFVFTRKRLLDKIDSMEYVFPIIASKGYMMCGNMAALRLWKNYFDNESL